MQNTTVKSKIQQLSGEERGNDGGDGEGGDNHCGPHPPANDIFLAQNVAREKDALLLLLRFHLM